MIKVLYFARLREQLGTGEEQLEKADDLATVGAVMERLKARGGPWAEVFGGDQPLLMAVNQEMASTGSALQAGDELAFFPPVTGG